MTDGTTNVTIPAAAPIAVELLIAVHGGDVDLASRLLSENPELARAKFAARGGTGTALHFVTDWPGYFPNGPKIVHLLIDAGADPNALTTGGGSATPGPGSETPLHYAASSDDVDVATALVDRGADLETPDGSIGTPLDNAVGYACWHVARLLVMRGARVEKIWHASALGMLDRLDDLLEPGIDPELVSQGFWHACGAGQRRAAERLLSAGADLNWEPDYAQGTALDAATGLGTRQNNVIEWLQSIGAGSAHTTE
jgi:ankyrin repeat protein